MNKPRFIGWVFWLGLLVSSCDNSTLIVPHDEIQLTTAIVPTSRGTDLNQQSTKIVANQPVGVTITEASTAHHNELWLADGHGMLVNVGPQYIGAIRP